MKKFSFYILLFAFFASAHGQFPLSVPRVRDDTPVQTFVNHDGEIVVLSVNEYPTIPLTTPFVTRISRDGRILEDLFFMSFYLHPEVSILEQNGDIIYAGSGATNNYQFDRYPVLGKCDKNGELLWQYRYDPDSLFGRTIHPSEIKILERRGDNEFFAMGNFGYEVYHGGMFTAMFDTLGNWKILQKFRLRTGATMKDWVRDDLGNTYAVGTLFNAPDDRREDIESFVAKVSPSGKLIWWQTLPGKFNWFEIQITYNPILDNLFITRLEQPFTPYLRIKYWELSTDGRDLTPVYTTDNGAYAAVKSFTGPDGLPYSIISTGAGLQPVSDIRMYQVSKKNGVIEIPGFTAPPFDHFSDIIYLDEEEILITGTVSPTYQKEIYLSTYKFNSAQAVTFETQLFPNPTHSYVNIEVKAPSTGIYGKSPVELSVYDPLGRMIFADDFITSELMRVDVSSWASGIYFFRLYEPALDMYSVHKVQVE